MAQQASQKDVGRTYRAVEKFLQEQANEKGSSQGQTVGVLHVTDLLRRYCSSLGLGHTDMRHATTIAEAACPRDAGYGCAGCHLPPTPPCVINLACLCGQYAWMKCSCHDEQHAAILLV